MDQAPLRFPVTGNNGAAEDITANRHAAVAFAKGAIGGREAMAHLASGGFLGMMMDQKMNDGIAVDFFGRPAKISVAPL